MMRIYDAKCSKCGNIDEVWGKADDTFRCGACGGESYRIISPVATSFKGRDWPGHEMKWARDHEKHGNK